MTEKGQFLISQMLMIPPDTLDYNKSWMGWGGWCRWEGDPNNKKKSPKSGKDAAQKEQTKNYRSSVHVIFFSLFIF